MKITREHDLFFHNTDQFFFGDPALFQYGNQGSPGEFGMAGNNGAVFPVGCDFSG
jgi:hypothetical protein